MALEDLVKQIFKAIGDKVFTPYDLIKYSTLVNLVSKKKTKREILSETYMCALLLPDNEIQEPNSLFSYVIKHPQVPGVDVIKNISVPRYKNYSVNTTHAY